MTEQKKKGISKTQLKIIGIGIIILALVIVFLALPAYRKHVRTKTATEIRATLEALRNTVDNYWKTNGSISGITLDQALADAAISPKVLEKWQFAIAWKGTELYTTEMVDKLKDVNVNQMVYISPYRMILAVGTAQNPVREGIKLWFLGDTNSYHGFGADEAVEPDWSKIFPNP